MTVNNKTIIISNRLPVKLTEENGEYNLSPSEGGLATGLGSVYKKEVTFGLVGLEWKYQWNARMKCGKNLLN